MLLTGIGIMIRSTSFQTRARAIDHLGREQIADVPTAISELWKNSFDAYARNASLHLFDDSSKVAVLTDDGHGMTYEDLINKWLVVGTESKAISVDSSDVEQSDRNGLPIRPKQGQKGIGRLSSAALGPLLLLLSKKKNNSYVALLIDWRLFENPYLFLEDIKIPTEEFESKDELQEILPTMFDELMSNIWGPSSQNEEDRKIRIETAWKDFSKLEQDRGKEETTQSKIVDVLINSTFNDNHFMQWPVWSGKSPCGTALFLSDINDDLLAQYGEKTDPIVQRAQSTFFSTLISFTNHMVEEHLEEFRYDVKLHKGLNTKSLVAPEKEFSHEDFEQLEHQVIGVIDENAIFTGSIKAYGQSLGEVSFPLSYKMPIHSRSKVGSIHIQLGSYEAQRGEEGLGGKQTSMDPAIWADIDEKLEQYSGLKVYRDGLRVMPYGRPDNDFFEIEARRSKNAGLYHYSLRNMTGAISLTSTDNVNLKDKAGREGFIENKASKAFKDIVILLLTEVASRYFGRGSKSIRGEYIDNLKESYDQRKAEADLKKEQTRKKRAFNKNLKSFGPAVEEIAKKVDIYIDELETAGDLVELKDVLNHQTRAEEFIAELAKYKVTHPPRNLKGEQEVKYRQYKDQYTYISSLLKSAVDSLNSHIEKLKPKAPDEVARNRFNRNIKILSTQLKKWESEAYALINTERARLEEMVEAQKSSYKEAAEPYIKDLEHEKLQLGKCLEKIDDALEQHQTESEILFVPYISTLQSLKENIDLASLAEYSLQQSNQLQEEVDRLNKLAQLGITVEIIGHELNHMQSDVDVALSKVTSHLDNPEDSRNLVRAYSALNEKLSFLSNMKLSGEAVREWITGAEIDTYCREFFGKKISAVDFVTSDEFLSFKVYEERSKIYPVFINVINNSLYWIRQKHHDELKVRLDFSDGKVIIADNGPGVYPDDIPNLFTIFFTKKIRGGRGVGLYLSRRNLASGGHTIYYVDKESEKILSGANFVIEFKGVRHG